MKKIIYNIFLISCVLVTSIYSCDADYDDTKVDSVDSRLLGKDSLFIAHANPLTGLDYTQEELASLGYNPDEEELYSEGQTIDLSINLATKPKSIDVISQNDKTKIVTITDFTENNGFYTAKFNTTVIDLGLEIKDKKTILFNITYDDLGQDGFNYSSLASITFGVTRIKPFDPNASLADDLVGYWRFNDATNLLKATRGNDLVLNGAASHSATAGVNAQDGAAHLDVGTWYDVNHSIPATGGARVNEFTMIWDVKVAAADLGKYICLLQFNTANDSDGSVYIHPNAGFWFNGGPGGHAGGTIIADTWHRIVLSVSAPEVVFYVDGNEIYKADIATVDGKFSLDPSQFLILGENSSNSGNGEDNPISISEFMLFKSAFSESQIATLQPIGVPAIDDISNALKGRWKFDDATNLLKASCGEDLVLNGAASHSATAGVNAQDGAAHLDVGTWYDVNHSIPATGGARVNEFTMIWDVKVAAADLGKYICLLQFNTANDSDGSVYIHPNAGFWFNGGPGGHAGGTIIADTWHRIVLSVSAPEVVFYVDGNEIYTADIAAVDGKFSLDPSQFLILGENSSNSGNGEDNPISISDFLVFDTAFTTDQIEKLPAIGTPTL